MRARLAAFALAITTLVPMHAHSQERVRLFAAGSLRAAMTDLADAFRKQDGATVDATYGASGLLRERLARGETADVFASANMEHPEALVASGRAGAVVMFARNRLCALVAPGIGATSQTLLDRMLEPAVKIGTSTPKADPSGDYAFELFAKADSLRPGARAVLETKALKLTGGPDSPPPPKDRSVYAMLVTDGKADIFLTYCTNARAAQTENAALTIVTIPEPLAVGANYGMTVLKEATGQGDKFARFVMSQEGQRMLAKHGFDAPGKP